MSRVSFENYARRTTVGMSLAEISGRYAVQEAAQRHIMPDVTAKLELNAEDSLLEIGCGAGNLLIPLSFAVSSATGIDHPSLLEMLGKRFTEGSIELLPGNFLDLDLTETYSKILVYSVLTCLKDQEELLRFIDKAAALLVPGGRLLLGDIQNGDRKRRFLATAHGRAFFENWQQEFDSNPGVDGSAVLEADPEKVQIDDALMLDMVRHVRNNGYESFLLPQSPELPFGYTREDILIIRPED